MKKLIASASLVAVGAAGLQAANAPGLTRTETSKPWSVSASLRGFYDDNYLAAPTGNDNDQDSYGFEVAPMAAVNFPRQQSYLGASYRYSMKYYEDRDDDEIDQTHEFKLKADHRFSERYQVYLNEVFIFTQEPELADPSLGSPNRLRTDAEAYRNNVKIGMVASLNERVGLDGGYYNGWYDYDDDGAGSRSAQLDRFEHVLHLDGLYELREDVDAILGYQFGAITYEGDEDLFDNDPGPDPVKSDIRDNTSHYLYVGTDADLSSTLVVSGRLGGQYTDFDDLGEDSLAPYANTTLTYTYAPGSYLQFGVTHRRNATDQVGIPGEDNVVADQQSTSVFGSANHKITAKLTGNLYVQGQYSEFQEGFYDGDSDKFLLIGANLEYEINQFLAAEAGYNFDRLNSDISDRSFTRNRVFLGMRASY